MKKMKAVKLNVSGVEKAKQAITALELAKKAIMNSAKMKQTHGQKMADIKDIDDKIATWKLKYAELA